MKTAAAAFLVIQSITTMPNGDMIQGATARRVVSLIECYRMLPTIDLRPATPATKMLPIICTLQRPSWWVEE